MKSAVRSVMVGGSRMYQIPSMPSSVPSVTSVLAMIDKPALRTWVLRTSLQAVRTEFNAVQVDGTAHVSSDWVDSTLTKAERATDDVLKAAAAFGTSAHDHIDRLVRGEAVGVVPPEVAPVVEGFKRWHAQSGLDLNPAGDTVVYSTKYGYAGALDCVGTRRSDGRLVIIDFKTSNSIHTTYAMQLAAYVNAYKELFGLEAVDAVAVRFDKKTGAFEEKRVANMEAAFSAFKAALYLWKVSKVELFTTRTEQ